MSSESTTLYVGPERVACDGVAPQRCLLVASDPAAGWQLHHETIDGFDFQPSFEYTLRVRVEPVEDPPTCASNRRLVLESVEVRRPAVPLAGTAWSLKEIEVHTGATPVIRGTAITSD